MNRKIRVLYILPLGGIGGAEKYVLSLCQHHDKSRFEIIVCILFSGGVVADEIESQGFEVIRLNMSNGFDILRACRLFYIIRSRKIDLVNIHGQTPLAKLLSALGRPPVLIHTDHGTTMGSPVKRRKRIVLFNRMMNPFIHHFIAISGNMKNSLMKRERVSSEKITLIYNGVDVERISKPIGMKDKLFSEMGIPEGIPVLGTVGRLSREKQLHLLFESLLFLKQRKHEFITLVVGGGPLRDNLERLVKQYNLSMHVRFLGSRSDVIQLLEVVDIFLFPSGGEAFSIILLEVMAKSLPIVAFDVEGVNEAVFSNETGFLVPFGSVKEFTDKINTLIESPSLARKMGQAAFKRVSTLFNINVAIKETEALYETLLGKVKIN